MTFFYTIHLIKTSERTTLDKFDDIRPIQDNEISDVLKRLSKNELLISTLRIIKWPNCPDIFQGSANFVVKLALQRKFKQIKTINEFQVKIIAMLLDWVLSRSSKGLTFSGIENLDKGKSCIFISNHRDITLDPAFLNYTLHSNGHQVPYIAFGDNLLMNDLVSDLIRVNKAFIVKRDLPPREQLKALKHLSEYIVHILQEGNHFWIAQREGRAKDGIDTTNPAIIKMFYLSKRKSELGFSEFIKTCNIVPVAISYENDPCDRIKAWEIYRKRKKGKHIKRKNEDLISMAAGISGDKGRIHVALGKPLTDDYKNEKEVASAIDRIIHQAYHLWPNNYVAYDLICPGNTYKNLYTDEDKMRFLKRYKNLTDEVKKIVFEIYANPVLSKEGKHN